MNNNNRTHNKSDRLTRLACRLKNGDLDAGEKLFNYFSPKIYRFVMVRILNPETAEDLTQEVFFKVVNRIETFDTTRGNFSGWIWQITRNTLKDHYGQKKSIPFSKMTEDAPEIKHLRDKKNGPEEKTKIQEVLLMIKRLSQEEQEIFSLRYLSDLSYKQIGKMTGKSEGALRILVHRVNKKIRQIIL